MLDDATMQFALGALERLQEQAADGQDIMQQAIAMGSEAAQSETASRLILGALTNLVDRTYGQANVQRFADSLGIGYKYGTLMQYAAVTGYYGISTAVDYLEQGVLYTHLRIARALGSYEASVALLDRAVDERLTAAQLERIVYGAEDDRTEDLIQADKHETLVRFDKVLVTGWDHTAGTITLALGDAADRLQAYVNGYVSVTIKAILTPKVEA